MTARLLVIEGPLTGRSFDLTENEISIGRSPGCTIVLPESSVSRRHCAIRGAGDKFSLTDLESMHGTRVNGSGVSTHELTHGDRIRIGHSSFVFLAEGAPVPPPAEGGVELIDTGLTSESALTLPAEELVDSRTGSLKTAQHLDTLLRISTIINTVQGVEPLGRRLLELIFEVIAAERGSILLRRGDSSELDAVLTLRHEGGHAAPFKMSRTILDRVLREKLSIWSNRVLEDEAWAEARSLLDARIRSVLCVPLLLHERVEGVVYLDSTDAARRFDESNLRLLSAIAAIAAPAFKNASRIEWLTRENERISEEAGASREMIGDSQAILSLYDMIARVSAAGSTVLICGESGTGKELVARAIHRNSPRAEKPFVAINCAAIAEQILESELFGHERGAFTGAIARKLGKFEIADGGTVFLDEISEMPLSLQPKLLRVLQERELERVGGTRPVPIDIRVIAATNRDLNDAVHNGVFRQDLYFRLNVVALTIPPLRDRREDIPLLAAHFAERYATELKRRIEGISPEAAECLTRYDWPGNVRELQNAIERAVVLGSGDVIRAEDLPESLNEMRAPDRSGAAGFQEAVNEAKRQIALRALDQAGGVITEAAKLLGLSPNYLHRLLKNLGLK